MSQILVERPLHAALFYHILTHLDLGRDAANLYRAHRPTPRWTAPLKHAYLNAPQRLITQILPLLVDGLPTLENLLQQGIPPLNDAPGHTLRHHLLTALDTEREEFTRRWHSQKNRDITHLLPRLQTLREHLWTPQSPPPLYIWDTHPLLAKNFTHARATQRQTHNRIALSLNAPEHEILIQILHEDTHSLTDPRIRKQFKELAQETHTSSPGYKLHHALELAAVTTGQHLFTQHAFDLLPAYAQWRKRFNI